MRGLGYLGWQFLFSYIFSDVTIALARFLAYLHDKADILLDYVITSYLSTGSCRSPEGFVNPEGYVKVKICSHKDIGKNTGNIKSGYGSCFEMSDQITGFTIHRHYEVSQGSLLSKETKAICLAFTAKEMTEAQLISCKFISWVTHWYNVLLSVPLVKATVLSS